MVAQNKHTNEAHRYVKLKREPSWLGIGPLRLLLPKLLRAREAKETRQFNFAELVSITLTLLAESHKNFREAMVPMLSGIVPESRLNSRFLETRKHQSGFDPPRLGTQ